MSQPRSRPTTTYTGRVVYIRKPHVFSGRDMTRIVQAVNNNHTGSYVNWLFVSKLSWRWVRALGEPDESTEELNEFLKKVLDLGRFVVEYVAPFLEDVPGAGTFVSIAADLYNTVVEILGYGGE